MDWRGLGQAITRRRVELGHHTIASFAPVVGLSTRILGDLEAGRRDSYDPATLARMETALEWPSGYVHALLHGEPLPLAFTTLATETIESNLDRLERVIAVNPDAIAELRNQLVQRHLAKQSRIGFPRSDDPLSPAAEIAYMLSKESPLPLPVREELSAMLQLVIAPYLRACFPEQVVDDPEPT